MAVHVPIADIEVAPSVVRSNLYLVKGTDAFRLGDVERFVWSLIDGRNTTVDIARAVSQKFDVAPDVADADVVEFVESLAEAELVSLEAASTRQTL